MNTQKRSRTISLALMGAVVTACGQNDGPHYGDRVYRDEYLSYEDCRRQLSDDECQPATIGHGGGAHYFGPYRSGPSGGRSLPTGAVTLAETVDSDNIGSVRSSPAFTEGSYAGRSEGISRGGFGEAGGAHAGGGE